MHDGLTLTDLHAIIDAAAADWADPRWRRRTLARAIERETRKLPNLQILGLSTAGLERRIARIREEHRAAVLQTARPEVA
ncbi:MAG: hypothetical protein M3Q71_08315 [Chloroflexota bacterium]|nr:hypothetical protein [Chloroflexota bacterium]